MMQGLIVELFFILMELINFIIHLKEELNEFEGSFELKKKN
jgi:hypothetical protein